MYVGFISLLMQFLSDCVYAELYFATVSRCVP